MNRLKTARGHLGAIVTSVEQEAYCPEVMKQLSAVQGLVESASRAVLRRHLQTCVAEAIREGRTEEIVDELMETLKFDKHVFRTPATPEPGGADADPVDADISPVGPDMKRNGAARV